MTQCIIQKPATSKCTTKHTINKRQTTNRNLDEWNCEKSKFPSLQNRYITQNLLSLVHNSCAHCCCSTADVIGVRVCVASSTGERASAASAVYVTPRAQRARIYTTPNCPIHTPAFWQSKTNFSVQASGLPRKPNKTAHLCCL